MLLDKIVTFYFSQQSIKYRHLFFLCKEDLLGKNLKFWWENVFTKNMNNVNLKEHYRERFHPEKCAKIVGQFMATIASVDSKSANPIKR